MQIDKYKIKTTTSTAELEEPLNAEMRTVITQEVDIYEVSHKNNDDGTYDEIYKAKLVGSTIVKQGTAKPILAKSKRSQSQKLRQAMWCVNPDEGYYNVMMDKLIANWEEVGDFLKDK